MTAAFRGLCDVTSSLFLNPVPVREDYTPEHTYSPTGATVRHTALSFLTNTQRKMKKGGEVQEMQGMQRGRGGFTRVGVKSKERRIW